MSITLDKKKLEKASSLFKNCAEELEAPARDLRRLSERIPTAWESASTQIYTERIRMLARRIDTVGEELRTGVALCRHIAQELAETEAQPTATPGANKR